MRHQGALAVPQVLATSDGTKNLYGLERRSRLAASGVGRAPWGIGVEQGGAWRYSLPDALGSVRRWADPAGAVLGAQSYGPFGEARDPVGTPPWGRTSLAAGGVGRAPKGFTGEWQDPAGMVYLRARWYNPALGRFTQVDPVAGLLAAPATQHPYAYVLNDPLNDTDPSGEFGLGALVVTMGVGALIGGISGGIAYAVAHPGHSLAEYVRDPGFQRTVISSAVGGAVGGLVGLALAPATFLGTVAAGAASGAASSAATQITQNVLTPCAEWHEDLLGATIAGGVAGGVTAGLVYGVGQWLRGSTLQRQLQAIADSVDQSVPGRGPVAGTLKHRAFQDEVDALGRPSVQTEVSFRNGVELRGGTRRGSIRADVVEWAIDSAGNRFVKAVYDLKTGVAKLTAQRIAQIQAHLPNPAPVIQIKPK